MLFSPIQKDAVFKDIFEHFRQEPYNRFVINVRRTRSEQIRKLLSISSSMDLKTFTDEIWNIEARTFWRSHDMSIAVFKETKNSGDYVERLLNKRTLLSSDLITWTYLERALISGDLELHGNYIWRQGSRVYDISKPKSEEQKIAQINKVIDILNKSHLSPVEKAASIRRVDGFGENTATGLVMIFHPEEFSIVNSVTKGALEKLNINIDHNELPTIQGNLFSLKEALEANDFIELDWFLYLITKGKYLQELPGEASNEIWLDYVIRVLQAADEPLSYTEIAQRAVALGLSTKGKTPAQTANRILTTHDELFERVDRGRYRLKGLYQERVPEPSGQGEVAKQLDVVESKEVVLEEYIEPPFEEILSKIKRKGMFIDERVLRSYYLSLNIRRLIILAGPSGTGKTWLAEAYAEAVGAAYQLVPVASNWTTNEDLLGYVDPFVKDVYHDTSFSSFLKQAANEYEQALAQGCTPRPYHLVLDEMNLSRVEHYFAKFLSAMEIRARDDVTYIELGPQLAVSLYPNFYFIGTVNIDETTHGFADKVYDRAQVLELSLSREDLSKYIGNVPYHDVLMQVWDDIHEVAPFAFRIAKEIQVYISEAEKLSVSWQDAIDDQIRQKVLPKCNGTDPKIGAALERLQQTVAKNNLLLSSAKVQKMLEGYNLHGISSYF